MAGRKPGKAYGRVELAFKNKQALDRSRACFHRGGERRGSRRAIT